MTYRGEPARIDDGLGTEIKRWRSPTPSRQRAAIRLLKRRDGYWGVLLEWHDVQMRKYPTQDAAETVAAQLRDSINVDWVEVDPSTTHWWG